MASYFLLDTAQRDLEAIWRFYDRIDGEDLADRRVADLHYRFQLLADYPYNMGRERPELVEGIRSFVSANPVYTIYYFPLGGYIEVAHILHGSQDLGQRLQLLL